MEEKKSKIEWVVSYKQLGLLILIFAIGFIAALLFYNAQTGSPTTFTTTELVGFTLSVILSGASIILAVTAIVLGKSAEQSVIKRSDESIRLQTDVFVRTNEALSRIEASTGVTEKRIEDIISGRAGDISQQIAEKVASGGKRRPSDIKEIEEIIRGSIESALKPSISEAEGKQLKDLMQEREKREIEYQKWHKILLYTVANKSDISVEKIGHGNLEGKGDDLFDGTFKKADTRFAIITFRPDVSEGLLSEFLDAAASELSKGTVTKIVFVMFGVEIRDEVMNKLKDQLGLLKEEISRNLIMRAISYDEVTDFAEALEL